MKNRIEELEAVAREVRAGIAKSQGELTRGLGEEEAAAELHLDEDSNDPYHAPGQCSTCDDVRLARRIDALLCAEEAPEGIPA